VSAGQIKGQKSVLWKFGGILQFVFVYDSTFEQLHSAPLQQYNMFMEWCRMISETELSRIRP